MGDPVWIKNFGFGPKRLAGVIDSVTGPVSYTVRLGHGRNVRRLVGHIHTKHGGSEGRVTEQAEAWDLESAEKSDGSELDIEEWGDGEMGGGRTETGFSEIGQGENKGTEMRGSPQKRVSNRERWLPSYLKDYHLK